jgi:hypothetical protein
MEANALGSAAAQVRLFADLRQEPLRCPPSGQGDPFSVDFFHTVKPKYGGLSWRNPFAS